MSLVDYSSSSSESSEDISSSTKECHKSYKKPRLTKPRLPLPEVIKNMTKCRKDEPTDNRDEHDGRIRSFDHERGNWATYMFIPVNLNLIEDLQVEINKSPVADVKLINSTDIHISLTKTVVLHHHWIDSFIKSIQKELITLKEFVIRFCGLKVYCNEERTRTFIGLTVDELFAPILKAIINDVDRVMNEFKLPKFYDDPSFHASILWCVGDEETTLRDHLKSLQPVIDSLFGKDLQDQNLNVKAVYCKSGNKLFTFNLPNI